jgi:pimeloyl-ACP methyl ester carboxylesterase
VEDSAGGHRLHFTEWGDADNPDVLLCVHGLTRCGRDFDAFAAAMQDRYRVICPDVVGRGESDWLVVKADYTYSQYFSDALALIRALEPARMHYVGTSMGGIIGMMVAAMPDSMIGKLVLNDIGTFLPKASLERIGAYVGESPVFPSVEAATSAVRAVSPFGPLSDAQWRALTVPLLKPAANGAGWVMRYDPAIGDVFRAGPIDDVDLTPIWSAIHCPVLITRGADSDLLLKSTFDAMCAKPGVRGVEFAGVGHAPMYQDPEQIDVVRAFLLGQ